MFIVVNHKISDPDIFWSAAQTSLPNLPEAGTKRVLNILPNKDMNECVCVWEADSIETLDAYLRSKVGSSSTETYYELDETHAMGLNK
jgi:hypothetical protein